MHQLRDSVKLGMVAVGVETQTRTQRLFHTWFSAFAVDQLWPLWPGGLRYVQGESLKARPRVFEHVSTSRLPARCR
jgi:hypothetical protein